MRSGQLPLIPNWAYRGPFVAVVMLLLLTATAMVLGLEDLGNSLAILAYLFLIVGTALAIFRYARGTLRRGVAHREGDIDGGGATSKFSRICARILNLFLRRPGT